jgi:AcrR family transcriptional regulator
MSKKLSSQFENNRQAILETTSRLFCDQGVSVTSFTDISRAVKLSKGTIYYYYPSKEHLIHDVAEYHLGRVTDSIFSWLETISDEISLEETLFALFASVFTEEDECRLHICLVNYAIMGNDMIKNMIREKITKWHTMVEVGLSKTGHPRQITDAVFTALDSIIMKRSLGIMNIGEKDCCAHIAKHV